MKLIIDSLNDVEMNELNKQVNISPFRLSMPLNSQISILMK